MARDDQIAYTGNVVSSFTKVKKCCCFSPCVSDIGIYSGITSLISLLLMALLIESPNNQSVQCGIQSSLQWRHNGGDGVSNHQPHDCLLTGLFRRRAKKTWKLRVTGICAGNSPVTGDFPEQTASNAENVSIWWHHHVDMWNVIELRVFTRANSS